MSTTAAHDHAYDVLPEWFTSRPGWDKRPRTFGTSADTGDRHNWIARVLGRLGWTVEWHARDDGGEWARCYPPGYDPEAHQRQQANVGNRFD